MLRLSLAWIHLLALGIGLGAIWARASSLAAPTDSRVFQRAFTADTWWAIAAVTWITTGLWRLLANTEKEIGYYMSNAMFHAKMGLLVLIIVLEVWPMLTLLKWRKSLRREPDADVSGWHSTARTISKISYFQCVLTIAMVLAAAAMARGFGAM